MFDRTSACAPLLTWTHRSVPQSLKVLEITSVSDPLPITLTHRFPQSSKIELCTRPPPVPMPTPRNDVPKNRLFVTSVRGPFAAMPNTPPLVSMSSTNTAAVGTVLDDVTIDPPPLES